MLVCVPKILDVLREHVMRAMRRLRKRRGWDFYSRTMVALSPIQLRARPQVLGVRRRRGAAAPDLEEFWRRLGFAVIQGYGLPRQRRSSRSIIASDEQGIRRQRRSPAST